MNPKSEEFKFLVDEVVDSYLNVSIDNMDVSELLWEQDMDLSEDDELVEEVRKWAQEELNTIRARWLVDE